jgi:sulfate/thiosulfate transport system ATP-binding protein
MSIAIKGVTKRFGNFLALDDVSLTVPDGCLTALLGPSGGGKTTLLRILAGLESPDSGTVHYDDLDFTQRSAKERNVGFVFQHYALFRHMTVFQNVAFGLQIRKWKKNAIKERVHELLALVRMDAFEQRYPSQLSGGQRQRVALARALAIEPKVLLLDEPFGALDAKVRQDLRHWLRRLHDELHVTSVFVTHDQEEAFEVADEVVIINKGRIEQLGHPQDVFDYPSNPFVMDFLGNVNVLEGRLNQGRVQMGRFEISCPDHESAPQQDVLVYVRPHEIDVFEQEPEHGALKAQIQRINAAGPTVKIFAVANDSNTGIHIDLSDKTFSNLKLKDGDFFYAAPRRARCFPKCGTDD